LTHRLHPLMTPLEKSGKPNAFIFKEEQSIRKDSKTPSGSCCWIHKFLEYQSLEFIGLNRVIGDGFYSHMILDSFES